MEISINIDDEKYLNLTDFANACKELYIIMLLKKHNGNILQIANNIGQSRTSIYTIIKDSNIDRKSYRPDRKSTGTERKTVG